MAAGRHLEFSKFGILVMYPVLERDSALPTKFRVNPIITLYLLTAVIWLVLLIRTCCEVTKHIHT